GAYLAFLASLPEAERARRAAMAGGADLPVESVSRDDGEAYAAWLAGRLPGARLCSDREWERAARGADDRRYPYGDMDVPAPGEACSLFSHGRAPEGVGACPAGAHPASRSPFGVDDMTGNVWEWVADSADVARPWLGTTRGGGWMNDDLGLWATNRAIGRHDGRVGFMGLPGCADAP